MAGYAAVAASENVIAARKPLIRKECRPPADLARQESDALPGRPGPTVTKRLVHDIITSNYGDSEMAQLGSVGGLATGAQSNQFAGAGSETLQKPDNQSGPGEIGKSREIHLPQDGKTYVLRNGSNLRISGITVAASKQFNVNLNDKLSASSEDRSKSAGDTFANLIINTAGQNADFANHETKTDALNNLQKLPEDKFNEILHKLRG